MSSTSTCLTMRPTRVSSLRQRWLSLMHLIALRDHPVDRCYEEHFDSTPDPLMLDTLRERLRARTLLYLSAQQIHILQ